MSMPLTHARIGYDSITTRGTVDASSEIVGYPATAAANQLTYSYWKAGLPSTWAIELDAAETCNYFGIAAHTLHSNNVVVAMQAYIDGAWATLPSLVTFGDVWRFAGDLFGDRGAAPGSTSGTLRKGIAIDGLPIMSPDEVAESKFGAYSVTVEPAVTNMCAENVRNCGDTNGDLTGFDPTSNASYNTKHAVSGAGCAYLDNSGSGATLATLSISASASTQYTFSCKFTTSDDTNVVTLIVDGNVTGTINIAQWVNVKKGKWITGYVPFTTRATDTGVILKIVTSVANTPIWVDEFQMETGAAPHTWVDGSKAAADTLGYPPEILQQCKDDVTFNIWFKAYNGIVFTYLQLFEAQEGSSKNLVSLAATRTGTSTLVLGTSDADANTDAMTYNFPVGEQWSNDWHMATVVLRPSISGEHNKFLYLDGRLVASKETTYLPTWQSVQTFDLGYDTSYPIGKDGLGVIGEFAAINKILTATEIKDHYDSDSAIDALALGLPVHDDDRPIVRLVEEARSNKFRLRFVGQTTPVVGVIYMGESLEMERSLYGGHTPINLARSTIIRPNTSTGGQFLGRSIIRVGNKGTWAWTNLTAAWVRNHLDPFLEAARLTPFFILWRPDRFPGESGYCWTMGDQTPSNMGVRDLMSFTLEAEGLGVE